MCRDAAKAPASQYTFAGRYMTWPGERALSINLLPVDRNNRDRLVSCTFSDWTKPPQVVRIRDDRR